jgi:hypothetical protein
MKKRESIRSKHFIIIGIIGFLNWIAYHFSYALGSEPNVWYLVWFVVMLGLTASLIISIFSWIVFELE